MPFPSFFGGMCFSSSLFPARLCFIAASCPSIPILPARPSVYLVHSKLCHSTHISTATKQPNRQFIHPSIHSRRTCCPPTHEKNVCLLVCLWQNQLAYSPAWSPLPPEALKKSTANQRLMSHTNNQASINLVENSGVPAYPSVRPSVSLSHTHTQQKAIKSPKHHTQHNNTLQLFPPTFLSILLK